MKITVVTPVYNEEDRAPQFLRELVKTGLTIVVVDDGSTDSTPIRLKKICQNNPQMVLLTHAVNIGKGATLKTGCEYAFKHGAEAVILIDSDGQHAVSDIDKFIGKLNTNNYEVVLGSRNLNLGIPIDRYLGNKAASVFVSLLFGIYVSDLICGFRGLTKKAYRKIKWESSGYGIETEMIVRIKKNKLKHCEVPVETIYYDSFKGVSILDAFTVLLNLMRWRLTL